ncbi:MAG: pitrilysin family protein [Dehalococcoidales bacterium]|nr:pitrilysin family protein [Dehalococcoidales bacterium]
MYQKTVLANGLRLVTSAMPHTHSVAVNFFIGTGSRYEDDTRAGVSHFIEHLCFRGTPTRPTSREISEAIEGTGGLLNAATDKELTVYWCKVARPHFQLALEVLSDMLRNSRFEPEDIEKERQVITEEINMCNDSPSQRVDLLIDELLWPRHPMGRDIAGSKESVAALTREMMRDYLQQQYQPGNTVLSIAGDIQHEEAIDTVNRLLGNWANPRPPLEFTPYREQPARQVLVENRDTEQMHLCLALPGISITHPRRFALGLLNIIFGEGMSSRLFTEVRDKLGLAYSIHSFVDHFRDTGALIISAGVDNEKLPTAVKAILAELAKIREEVPEQELARAKELSRGRLLLRMEDSRNVSGWGGGEEMLTGKIITVDQVIGIVDAVTVADLRQIAQELINDEKLRLAVVGPVENEDTLAGLLRW